MDWNTNPTPLDDYQLEDWTCPTCGMSANSGTQHFEARGAFQTINVHHFTCLAGHRWDHTTDGG